MDKIIAVIFDNEAGAFQGLEALQELHYDGSITVYASGAIKKQPDGQITVLRETDEGPLGTGVGLLTGSLVGLVGGPAGVAVGGIVGAGGGMLYDLAKLGLGEDFLYEIGENLQPSKTAVVAEVWEEWMTPVDSRMEAIGGAVYRRLRGEVEDAQIERDAAAFTAEIEGLESEIKVANAEAKVKLQAKLDETKLKLRATQDRAKTTVEAGKQEMDAKINSLQDQFTKASAETKRKMEVRIAEMKETHKKRTEKLRQAWGMVKEAAAM